MKILHGTFLPKNSNNNKYAILDRRRQVAALYLEGKTQTEIARLLGTRQPNVCLHLKAIRKEWLASCVRDFDEAVAEELAKLNNIEAEAWAAFERSCQPSTATQERVATNTKGVPVQRVVGIRVEEGGVGDPRFLERVSWCVLTRLRLLGFLHSDGSGKPLPIRQINWDAMLEPLEPLEKSENGQANGQRTEET